MKILLYLIILSIPTFSLQASNLDDLDKKMAIDIESIFKDTRIIQDEETSINNKEISSSANKNNQNEKYSKTPICSTIKNMAPYSVRGTITTDYDIWPNGKIGRHQSNFRLKPKEITEFCTTGPFYEGGRIDFSIRTLIPIFSCKTKIDKPIIIIGTKKINGGYNTKAVCE